MYVLPAQPVLSPKTQYSLKNAKEYFEEHLCTGDYYSEGERIAGQWIGKGAAMLGLGELVTRDEFLRLCDNLHPQTSELLTQRRKTIRLQLDENGDERKAANRRVFYDFTLSPPKDVSILALVAPDQRITAAHDRAVKVSVAELEQFAGTRIRSAGALADRCTANVVGAIFRHDTSRALDPHLHSHCIIFNATHDSVEGRWKALQNYEMLAAQKYVENVYYHELARELGRLGYEIENRARGDFVVRGISPELREKFSKRHLEIDEKTRELLAREPEKSASNVAEIREHIAHNERSRKVRDIGSERLKELWHGQLKADEGEGLRQAMARAQTEPCQPGRIGADEALKWAEDHLFDRKSVIREHELWRHALEYARGCDLDVPELKQASAQRGYIRDGNESRKVTSREILAREWDVLERVKNGIDRHAPFSTASDSCDPALDPEQREAVEKILGSRDFVTLFRGGAGTGKSFALREVLRGMKQSGHAVQVIAPQRQQVIDLQRDGFDHAQTVSEFLTKGEMQRGAVIILDEAGQLGARQMQALLRVIEENEGRLIASGDTRQHGAVEASDALRAIEKYSGLHPAELHEVRRQDPRRGKTPDERVFIEEYRRAVKDAAEGDIVGAFDRLSEQGVVVECTLANQQDKLAEHYLALAARGQSTVVVSQTWSEIHKVNEVVRQSLISHGLIGTDEHTITALERTDLTDAQKRDKRHYSPDTVLVFNQKCGRFCKGEVARLVEFSQQGLIVESPQRAGTIAVRHLDRVTVCREREMTVAPGDQLQLKANSQTRDGRRIANGEIVMVERINADGRLLLKDGRILENDYRQFVRGYAVTSYASQGKTVDYVLFSDSAVKAATNRQQWYVTISRGRKGIRIFTSDRRQLRENAARSGDRELALDLQARATAPRQSKRRLWSRTIARGRRVAVDLWRRFKTLTNRRTPPIANREVMRS